MKFTEQYINKFCLQFYYLDVEVKPLNGYDELNFLLTDNNSRKFILKVATDDHGIGFLDAQVKMVSLLSNSPIKDKFQRYIYNKDGQEITTIHNDGERFYMRILTFLDGELWVYKRNKSDELYISLGKFMGRMDKILENFSHPALHRYHVWDINTAINSRENLEYISDPNKREITEHFLDKFEIEVLPLIPLLRNAYIHNDANDYNILLNENYISGLIDFGDIIYTTLINNLAIACTYAMLNTDNPLRIASIIVGNYHKEYPLTMTEVNLIYYLIAARLCISVTQSAYKTSIDYNNEHHFVTEKHAWDLLFKLIQIDPIKAKQSFQEACGFENNLININQ